MMMMMIIHCPALYLSRRRGRWGAWRKPWHARRRAACRPARHTTTPAHEHIGHRIVSTLQHITCHTLQENTSHINTSHSKIAHITTQPARQHTTQQHIMHIAIIAQHSIARDRSLSACGIMHWWAWHVNQSTNNNNTLHCHALITKRSLTCMCC